VIPRGVRAAGIIVRQRERRSLRSAFVFVAAISAHAQSNPGIRAILRFPNPIEVKTSPKSWR